VLFAHVVVEDIGGSISYELYGVINHMGTMTRGHYTAYVKHFTSEQWFTISDVK
jgi:ubiquitin C-terminal hydrolase